MSYGFCQSLYIDANYVSSTTEAVYLLSFITLKTNSEANISFDTTLCHIPSKQVTVKPCSFHIVIRNFYYLFGNKHLLRFVSIINC